MFLQKKKNKKNIDFPLIMGFGMYKHLTLTVSSMTIICLEISVDPDQLASEKPADQDPRCFQLCLKIHTKYMESCELIG